MYASSYSALLSKDSSSLVEKFQRYGITSLSNAELILLALGKTHMTKHDMTLVKRIMEIIKKSHGEMSYLSDLTLIDGLDLEKSIAIIASLQLSRRYFFPERKVIESPEEAYKLLLKRYSERFEENFICITLNAAQEVIRIREVSRGVINKVIIQPREVFSGALTDHATAILVAHNHPSGNVLPSEEDEVITKRLLQAGKVLGIPLLDHIVFAEKNYFSFRENGKMDT